MTLLVSVGRPRYVGQFHERAKALVLAGTRVGMMWTCETEKTVHCHVCNKDFVPPVLDPVSKDAWGECTHCHTAFIFADPLSERNQPVVRK